MEKAALTAAQLAEIRAQLLQLRASVTAAVDRRLHGADDDRRAEAGLPRRADETDDDAAAETARMSDLHELSRRANELDRIDAALARVDEGSYGVCVDCDEPINPQRLRAYPAAMRCAGCQEDSEKRRGPMAPRN